MKVHHEPLRQSKEGIEPVRVDRSRVTGIEILMTETLVKIKPTDPLR